MAKRKFETVICGNVPGSIQDLRNIRNRRAIGYRILNTAKSSSKDSGGEDYFEFVTHSMGTAEAAGISDFLKMNGWKVKDIYSFEAMQAADILINKSNTNDQPTIILDYQYLNDWVINDIPIARSPGNIEGADIIEQSKSNKGWRIRHRGPIDDGLKTWDEIKQFRDKPVNLPQTK